MTKSKQAAGRHAATWIKPGMIVGLGTGSTAAFFIEALIEKNIKIQAVASSETSAELAKKGGIQLIDINCAPSIDITVDGADEIDAQKRMIKGGGGALLREKILASSSKEMVVIVDETKVTNSIGHVKLPVEITPYGSESTKRRIELLGLETKWRMAKNSSLFITDNNNLILDIKLPSPPKSPETLNNQLLHIPGVVDTGFFFQLAGRVIVGYSNGSIQVIS